MNFPNMALMGGRGLQSMAPGMRGAGMAQPLGPQKPGMRDMMGAVGGMLSGAGGQGQAQMDSLPTAPAIPIQVLPLNPLYDFEHFRFNFGNQPSLLG